MIEIIKFNEKLVTFAKCKSCRNGSAEVIVNPDRDEIRDFKSFNGPFIRFIADADTKEVFIFPAHLLHRETTRLVPELSKYEAIYNVGLSIFRAIRNDQPYSIQGYNPNVFFGDGEIEGASTIVTNGSDFLSSLPTDVLLLHDSRDYDWAKQYVRGIDTMIDHYKEKEMNSESHSFSERHYAKS